MLGYNPHITLPSVIFEKPAASILLPVTLGNIVGFMTGKEAASPWYKSLKRPAFAPPNWIFGPTWFCLYCGMGYAAHRAWTVGLNSFDPTKRQLAKQGATLFTLQLVLNLLWTPLFFKLRRPITASVEILALLGLNGYLTYVWSGVDDVAAWLQVPYMGWLSFATYLSVSYGYLNGWDFSIKEEKKE